MKHFLFTILFLPLFSCQQSAKKNLTNQDLLNESIKKLSQNLSDSILTKKKISDTPDSVIEDLIFHNIYQNINVTLESSNADYRKEFEKFTRPQKIFYSTLCLERNITYGGFRMYISAYQSVGQFYPDASSGFTALGFRNLSKLIDSIMPALKNKLNNADSDLKRGDTIFLNELKKSNTTLARLNLVRLNIDSFTNK